MNLHDIARRIVLAEFTKWVGTYRPHAFVTTTTTTPNLWWTAEAPIVARDCECALCQTRHRWLARADARRTICDNCMIGTHVRPR